MGSPNSNILQNKKPCQKFPAALFGAEQEGTWSLGKKEKKAVGVMDNCGGKYMREPMTFAPQPHLHLHLLHKHTHTHTHKRTLPHESTENKNRSRTPVIFQIKGGALISHSHHDAVGNTVTSTWERKIKEYITPKAPQRLTKLTTGFFSLPAVAFGSILVRLTVDKRWVGPTHIESTSAVACGVPPRMALFAVHTQHRVLPPFLVPMILPPFQD